MKMTLEQAKQCLDPNERWKCETCPLNDQTEFDCRRAAYEVACSAINYIMIGGKLAKEIENKER